MDQEQIDNLLKYFNKISNTYLLPMAMELGLSVDDWADLRTSILMDVFDFIRKNSSKYNPSKSKTTKERYLQQLMLYYFQKALTDGSKEMQKKFKEAAKVARRDRKLKLILDEETSNK